jgi:hypothetical protein
MGAVRSYTHLGELVRIGTKAFRESYRFFGQEAAPLIMPKFLTVVLLLSSNVFGGEWVVTNGGLSYDKMLAVAVYPQKSKISMRQITPFS